MICASRAVYEHIMTAPRGTGWLLRLLSPEAVRLLVVGGGPAGVTAALQACEPGEQVTTLDAGQIGGFCKLIADRTEDLPDPRHRELPQVWSYLGPED